MKIAPELFMPSQFTLLTAPVAAGKTRLIVEYYREHNIKMIFVSPLRALANEVYQKLSGEGKNVFLAGAGHSTEEVMTNFLQARKGLLIATMELLNEDFLEACAEQHEKILFVLDEFHLFYHWGSGFRPILHDRFLAILDTQAPVMGITATMSVELLERVKNDLSFHHDFWIHLDFGNHQLHRLPKKIHYYLPLKPDLFYRSLWRELRTKNEKDVYLVFCLYRSEVDEMVARSRRMGLKSIGCVGGEVEAFLKELKAHEEQVDCIFSTTTLSHGVNLPEIKKVFLNYEVKDYDFWLQMIGRGGRQGSEYEVYTFDSYHSNKKEKMLSYATNLLSDWTCTLL